MHVAGAMRLPGSGELDCDGPHVHHYLTDYYAQKFSLPVVPFINSTEEGYYMFKKLEDKDHCEPKIKMKGKQCLIATKINCCYQFKIGNKKRQKTAKSFGEDGIKT